MPSICFIAYSDSSGYITKCGKHILATYKVDVVRGLARAIPEPERELVKLIDQTTCQQCIDAWETEARSVTTKEMAEFGELMLDFARSTGVHLAYHPAWYTRLKEFVAKMHRPRKQK